MGGFGNARTRPNEPPMPDPLGFFLTWTTYGTWLPGDERGWVRRGGGLQAANPARKKAAQERMTESPCTLDIEQRALVERTVAEHCALRGWQLHAVSCRTAHVHVVVSADRKPKTVASQLKAWCTRKLKTLDCSRGARRRENWWTERGSERYLGDQESLEAAIRYVRDCQ